MKISVAMCSYNGSKYIKKQLESIINQEQNVDEIVICDNVSSDNTIEIIKEIASTSPITIRLYQNDTNIGLVRNFAKSISLCTGDIIFLSDHDDIWKYSKVKEMVKVFEEKPDIDLISSDAEIIDENGNPTPNDSLWKHIHVDCFKYFKEQGLIPDFCFATGRVTGATIAFRNKKPYNDFMTYHGDFYFHDETISFLSIVNDKYFPLDKKLIQYRVSSAQTCGLPDYIFDHDIRIPKSYALKFRSLPLDAQWKERLDFVEERLRYNKYPFKILFNLNRYKKCYGKNSVKFAWADFRRFIHLLLFRLHLVKFRDWEGEMHPMYK